MSDLDDALAAAYATHGATSALLPAIELLLDEHRADDARAAFERGGARDLLGREAEAVPLYREALALGLAGDERLQCLVQLGSSLRNVGEPEAAVDVLREARAEAPPSARDQVDAFLALALHSRGEQEEALAVALGALAPHLTRYGRAVSAYAGELAMSSPRAAGPTSMQPLHRPVARRLFELTEPISLVNFFSPEPNEAMAALGFRGYWDGYFAGRSAPLGRVPAEVVDAAFYSFAEGEVARHVPKVWETTTPEAAHAARQQGCVAALRTILGDLADTPGCARAAELLARASTSAPTAGRVVYAGLRSLPVPEEPVARLWFAANMLREHRGDGHTVALVAEQIGGTEAHVLTALDHGIHPAESFGRIHHLPPARLAEVMDGLRARGLLDAEGRFTDAGRATKDRIEALTDALAEAPYDVLTPAELDELVGLLEPISSRLQAVGSNSEAVG